jgi:hypothetical protein
MDHPARYAKQLLITFISSARQNGVPHAPIHLVHGDFLQSNDVREAMSCAGVVYMNNPKFGPELNLKVLCSLCPLMPKGSVLVCHEWAGLDQWDGLKLTRTFRIKPGICGV